LAHLRKQIRDNVVTALTGLSTTGSRVYASRVYPMAAANLPGLCVYAKTEEVETTTITRPRTQFRTLTLSVEGFVVATSGLDNTLDAISLEVEEALAIDPSRSNLAKDTRVESIEAEYVDDGEQPVGTIRIALDWPLSGETKRLIQHLRCTICPSNTVISTSVSEIFPGSI
jgi:hypothetical protein